jgi:hypothetical protein
MHVDLEHTVFLQADFEAAIKNKTISRSINLNKIWTLPAAREHRLPAGLANVKDILCLECYSPMLANTER